MPSCRVAGSFIDGFRLNGIRLMDRLVESGRTVRVGSKGPCNKDTCLHFTMQAKIHILKNTCPHPSTQAKRKRLKELKQIQQQTATEGRDAPAQRVAAATTSEGDQLQRVAKPPLFTTATNTMNKRHLLVAPRTHMRQTQNNNPSMLPVIETEAPAN